MFLAKSEFNEIIRMQAFVFRTANCEEFLCREMRLYVVFLTSFSSSSACAYSPAARRTLTNFVRALVIGLLTSWLESRNTLGDKSMQHVAKNKSPRVCRERISRLSSLRPLLWLCCSDVSQRIFARPSVFRPSRICATCRGNKVISRR